MKRKQILDKFKMTEISAVDRPCQEHAKVAIMKRAPSSELLALQQRIDRLKKSVDAVDEPINKFWSVAARLAAVAARRLVSRGKAAATRRGRKMVVRGAKHAIISEAKGAAIGAGRKAVTGAAVTAATTGATAAWERAQELLEERRKKRAERARRFSLRRS